MELIRQSYSKTSHREALRLTLPGRSEGAIEMKHQNISAVLLDLGFMWIRGYKPLVNYQQRLFEIVAERVESDASLDKIALDAAEQPAEPRLDVVLEELVVPKPGVPANWIGEERAKWCTRVGIKRDYLEREARNRALGLSGELLAVQFEMHRLHRAGKQRLADRVEHVSKTQGDGLGYDILSFEESGRERFVEVKTTAFAALTPFFVSANEVACSREFKDQYWLYRIHEFRDDPRMFQLEGAISASCRLDPTTYRASPL